MRLSRDQILKADDIETEEVTVPEWPGDDGEPGTVLVRGLTARERDAFEESMYVQHGKKIIRDTANIRAKLVIRCVVDDDGNPLFGVADIADLGEKSGAALDRLWDVASRLSRMSEEDIEELGKDSASGQTADSGSSSPVTSAARSRNSAGGSRRRS